ncbi:hypothetical protein K402DRAFT_451200, partial [Aulographum hederae CBS 113979]
HLHYPSTSHLLPPPATVPQIHPLEKQTHPKSHPSLFRAITTVAKVNLSASRADAHFTDKSVSSPDGERHRQAQRHAENEHLGHARADPSKPKIPPPHPSRIQIHLQIHNPTHTNLPNPNRHPRQQALRRRRRRKVAPHHLHQQQGKRARSGFRDASV